MAVFSCAFSCAGCSNGVAGCAGGVEGSACCVNRHGHVGSPADRSRGWRHGHHRPQSARARSPRQFRNQCACRPLPMPKKPENVKPADGVRGSLVCRRRHRSPVSAVIRCIRCCRRVPEIRSRRRVVSAAARFRRLSFASDRGGKERACRNGPRSCWHWCWRRRRRCRRRKSGQPSSFANANIRARESDRSMKTRMLCNV